MGPAFWIPYPVLRVSPLDPLFPTCALLGIDTHVEELCLIVTELTGSGACRNDDPGIRMQSFTCKELFEPLNTSLLWLV